MTVKQKIVASRIVENHGNVSKTMKDAGYASATAKNPKNLTNSKGWMKLMEKHIPDGKLLQKHSEALDAVKPIGAQILIDKDGKTITKENEGMIEVPDHPTRLKAVELGYRVKGKLRPEEGASNTVNILVVPSELIEKYDTTVTQNASDSSTG